MCIFLISQKLTIFLNLKSFLIVSKKKNLEKKYPVR